MKLVSERRDNRINKCAYILLIERGKDGPA